MFKWELEKCLFFLAVLLQIFVVVVHAGSRRTTVVPRTTTTITMNPASQSYPYAWGVDQIRYNNVVTSQSASNKVSEVNKVRYIIIPFYNKNNSC
jgi:hypothetical protein